VRDAVYSELIRLSPASNYDRELVSGSKGLLARGFLKREVVKFGALPPEMRERDKLAYKLSRFMTKNFSSPGERQLDVPLIGIPGFWQESSGRVRLWKKVRRMTDWLKQQGKTVNQKRVRRLLRLKGLQALYRKR